MKKIMLLISLFSIVEAHASAALEGLAGLLVGGAIGYVCFPPKTNPIILEKIETTTYTSETRVCVDFKQEGSEEEKAIRDAFNELDAKTKNLFSLLEQCKDSGNCQVYSGEFHMVRGGKIIETTTVDRTIERDGLAARLLGDGRKLNIHMIYRDRTVRNILNPDKNRPN
jgi:hypothetical protein